MVNLIKNAFLCFIFLGLICRVSAENYYVSNSSNSKDWISASDINTPCDAATAFKNAVAGDTVFFRGGAYTVPKRDLGNWLSGYYNPSNSGTEGNPIVFMAYPGEIPLFNGTSGGTADKDGHGYYDFATLFGINDYQESGKNNFKEYIIYDGFSMQADGGTAEARVSLARGDNSYSGQRGRGIVIKNCTFNGGTNVNPPHSEGGTGDNREGLFISQLTGVIVSNCRFFNYDHTANNHNTSAIKTYHSDNVNVENCEIYNCTIGVFYKSNTDDSKIAFNYINNCNAGVIAGAFGWWNDINDHSKGYFISESDNLEIHNNIFSKQKRVSISIENEDGGCTDGMRIYNNTFYTGNEKGVSVSLGCGIGQVFFNNIIYGLRIDGDVGLLRWYCRDNDPERVAAGVEIMLEIDSADHNQFGDLPSNLLIRFRRPDSAFVSYSTLPSWQNSNELINLGHPGEGDLVSDPMFVNVSGNMSIVEDFALQENSPCKGTGLNGSDMGADVRKVGVRNDLATSVNEPGKNIVSKANKFGLFQNYPNPFNPATVISYKLKVRSEVELKIYDILGREVITLVNEARDAGEYTVEWNGKNAAGKQVGSGVYFYKLKTNNGFVSTKKMILLK